MCCESILIFPLLFILEIVITLLYDITLVFRFLLEEIVSLIYSLPLYEVIDYIILKVKIVDDIYYKIYGNTTDIRLCIKEQSFLTFIISHFKDKRL